uniref:Uncharacterized protein n=1 Tax=Rhizophora mucronata TaxID=61149 RepID=A0A2P2PU90_RHIMU
MFKINVINHVLQWLKNMPWMDTPKSMAVIQQKHQLLDQKSKMRKFRSPQ